MRYNPCKRAERGGKLAQRTMRPAPTTFTRPVRSKHTTFTKGQAGPEQQRATRADMRNKERRAQTCVAIYDVAKRYIDK